MRSFYSMALAALLATVLTLSACGGGGGGGSGGGEPSGGGYPHAGEPIGGVRQIYDGVLPPDLAVNTFRNTDRLFPTRTVAAGGTALALPRAATQLQQVRFSSGGADIDLQSYMALNRVAGLLPATAVSFDGDTAIRTGRPKTELVLSLQTAETNQADGWQVARALCRQPASRGFTTMFARAGRARSMMSVWRI